MGCGICIHEKVGEGGMDGEMRRIDVDERHFVTCVNEHDLIRVRCVRFAPFFKVGGGKYQ